MAITSTIAGRRFELDRKRLERAVADSLPEPLRDHYVVVGGTRFPPKQVIALATGLDRADFTTHQARRVLRRLGFSVARRSDTPPSMASQRHGGPFGGQQAEALRPHVGKWVAQRGSEVLVAADLPQDVLAWLERHDEQADSMFRVPVDESAVRGMAPS